MIDASKQPGSGITILGAGPAGLTAALVLGRKGIPCTLIDKNHSPRPKICGDGLSGKVLSTLGKIDPVISQKLCRSHFATASYGVRFYSPAGRMAEISFRPDQPGQPPGLVCSRQDFDHFLLEEVLVHPSVNYLPGFEIQTISRFPEGWLLSGKDGRQLKEPGLLMVATGTDRKLLSSLGHALPLIGTEGIGVRAYFDPVTGSGAEHAIEIHFLRELLPWYFWIFPYQDGSANIGLALPSELAGKKKESLRKLLFRMIERYPSLQSRFSGASLNGKIEAHRLPYYQGRMELGGDRYIMLGDAAYLVDPFTGEGIGNAMVSGKIAAEMTVDCREKREYGQGFARAYTAEIYRKLEAELALGLRLQKLARQPRLLNLVIGRAAKSEKVRTLLEEMLYSMNSKGKLSQPLFYLKLMLGI